MTSPSLHFLVSRSYRRQRDPDFHFTISSFSSWTCSAMMSLYLMFNHNFPLWTRRRRFPSKSMSISEVSEPWPCHGMSGGVLLSCKKRRAYIVCLESDDDNLNVHLHDPNDSKSVGNGSSRSTIKHSESIATTTTTATDPDDWKFSVLKSRKKMDRKWREAVPRRTGAVWERLEIHLTSSHAQGHFLWLLKDGIPLPDKVRESGSVYTLSGKPLNGHSNQQSTATAKKESGDSGAFECLHCESTIVISAETESERSD